MMESGMDVDRQYALIRKMNVLQGKGYPFYKALYVDVKQQLGWWN